MGTKILLFVLEESYGGKKILKADDLRECLDSLKKRA